MADRRQASDIDYIDASTLHELQSHDDEYALIDVREAAAFSTGHLWLANTIPYSRLELRIRRFVPRPETLTILCDDGDGLAEQAADNLEAIGYTNIKVLYQGIPGWIAAGFETVDGNYVIAHSLGYFIEEHYHTPVISAEELKVRLDNDESMVIIDTRSEQDYRNTSIAGSISVPAAEVARRVPDLISDNNTPIIVHCAGITRAALGAQALINCGIENPVHSLIDGTRGWDLVDGELKSDQAIEEVTPSAQATSFSKPAALRLAEQHRLEYQSVSQIENWITKHPGRTVYKIDIRSEGEYQQGHYPGTIWIPGGELVGMTIDHLATHHARLCLFADPDCARAEITASWMKQQGWREIVIVTNWRNEIELEVGAEPRDSQQEISDADGITPERCKTLLESGDSLLLDFSSSASHQEAHIPGAVWASRARLFRDCSQLGDFEIICSSEDASLAKLAARDLRQLLKRPVNVLRGGNQAWVKAGFKLESGINQTLGEIDDIDMLAPPDALDRDAILRWHRRGITWRHALYQQFKKDEPVQFQAPSLVEGEEQK